MRIHFRSRNIGWLFLGGLIVLIVLTFIAGISGAQASIDPFSPGQIVAAPPGSVRVHPPEQGVEPQIVIASRSTTCGEDEMRVTVEVWNVGSEGGDAYAQAVMKGSSCLNGKLTDPQTIYGTFSGGPNGILTFPNWGPEGLACHFAEGVTIKCTEEDVVLFLVENPEAFGDAQKKQESDCYPQISNIDNLKPGDVLSPAIDFVDAEGKPADILGHALFINGVETWSVVWDGKETRLELQYTCTNHEGYSKVITLPAYGGTAAGLTGGEGSAPIQPPQAPAAGGDSEAPVQPGQGPLAPPANPPATSLPGIPGGLPAAIGIAGLAIGLGGAALSGGAMVVSVLNSALTKPPVIAKPPAPKQTQPGTKSKTQEKKETKQEKEAEKKKKEKEKKKERKGLLQSEKEALQKYKQALDDLSENAEKAIDLVDGLKGISPDSKKRVLSELKKFKEALGNVSDMAGNYSDKVEMIQGVMEQIRSLGQQYKQIQKAHQEAFKDLEDVPEGAANQLADLTTAIESFGHVADAALSRIPYFKEVYSDEAFEVTKSFKEFATGLRKTFAKTIFRTAIEAKKEFTAEELKAFGDMKVNRRQDPEMQEWLRQQARKQPKKAPGGVLQKVKDLIFGKEVPPEVQTFH
jgi:hypothetical protein